MVLQPNGSRIVGRGGAKKTCNDNVDVCQLHAQELEMFVHCVSYDSLDAGVRASNTLGLQEYFTAGIAFLPCFSNQNRRFLPSTGKKPFSAEKSGRHRHVHVVIKRLGTCI